jgi:transcriptional accessory protein Tex/SPT6
MITRRVRGNLNRAAEKAALDVFSENLRNLLLTPPCKGSTILGIDPGRLHRFVTISRIKFMRKIAVNKAG